MIPETEKISDDDVAFAKERVNEMATRYHAWDLSDNDAAALRTLLSKIEEQERELVRLREGWVSVKDRLPERHGVYLCHHEDELTVISYFAGESFYNDGEPQEITHWMPLPAPPRPFTSQEVYEARICSRCDHSHASHNDGHPHLGCDVPSEQGAPCGCEKFTSQEVYEGIPELVAKAEEMEKQGVVDVPKVGE